LRGGMEGQAVQGKSLPFYLLESSDIPPNPPKS